MTEDDDKEKKEKNRVRQAFEGLYQEEELPERLRQDYRMVSCLSFSESRQVYLVEDRDSGSRYVLKRRRGKDAGLLKQEYDVLTALKEPFAPRATLYFEESRNTYLLREYISGETLEQRLDKKGVYGKKEGAAAMLEICSMVRKLHRQSPPLIHRDIKPQNILVAEDGSYKLIDWETAREYKAEETYDTVFLGTRATAAPEQFGYQQTSVRTDIYSLGVLFLYLLTGGYKARGRAWEALPPAFRRTIGRCLAFDPKDRYPSVRALMRDLSCLCRFSCRCRAVWFRGVSGAAILAVIVTFLYLGLSDTRHPADAVSFANPQVEEAARRALQKAADEPVTVSELEEVTTLILCGDQVFASWEEHEDYHATYWFEVQSEARRAEEICLTDLEYFPNLSTLVLDNQGIKDVSALSGLSLSRLSLRRNQITDIEPLTDCSGLTVLYLNDNPLSDMDSLIRLENLRELNLSGTEISSLSELQEMKLTLLDISNTQVRDFSILYTLPQIEALWVSGADTAAIARINSMTGLKRLGLFDSEIREVSELSALNQLECLDLSGSKRIEDLQGISDFSRLTYLGLGSTGVTDISDIVSLPELQMLEIINTPAAALAPVASCRKLERVWIDSGKEARITVLGIDAEVIVSD